MKSHIVYNVVGLMSGTSLDGLDIAFCSFKNNKVEWSFELKTSKSVSYDDSLQRRLKESINLSTLELEVFDKQYGKWLGTQVKSFINECGINADFIASHGHTVHHRPDKGITHQIGSGREIANVCGMKVICDFRSKDVSLGGQGAPLVPVGDKYLFSEYDFCLNLGGISNISFEYKGQRVAYDIGLANMILNHIASLIELNYDEDGKIARSGRLSPELFNKLNTLAYYNLPFPKSTGYEWFAKEVIPLIDNYNASIEDKLCTAVHHIAYSVARDVRSFSTDKSRLLVTGGGAKNDYLMECLKYYFKKEVSIYIPDNQIIDFKEAIVFAFLGVLKLRNEVNCLKSVTGASADNVGGVIFKG